MSASTRVLDIHLLRPWLDETGPAPSLSTLQVVVAAGASSGALPENHPLVDALDDRDKWSPSLEDIRWEHADTLRRCLDVLEGGAPYAGAGQGVAHAPV